MLIITIRGKGLCTSFHSAMLCNMKKATACHNMAHSRMHHRWRNDKLLYWLSWSSPSSCNAISELSFIILTAIFALPLSSLLPSSNNSIQTQKHTSDRLDYRELARKEKGETPSANAQIQHVIPSFAVVTRTTERDNTGTGNQRR